MNGSLQGKAMYIGISELGVRIEKISDSNPLTIYISVPKDGDLINGYKKKMYDEVLAQRFKEIMCENNSGIIVKYKTRDEYWTQTMAEIAKKEAYRMVMS